jgi:hypothetical protein
MQEDEGLDSIPVPSLCLKTVSSYKVLLFRSVSYVVSIWLNSFVVGVWESESKELGKQAILHRFFWNDNCFRTHHNADWALLIMLRSTVL